MEHSKKPLEGIRVMDFTRVYSGPYCTMLLGDLGAEVIKIERAGFGDDTHFFAPVKGGESGYFTYLNRNKKSLTLDLKKPEAVEIVKELAKECDFVVENFSPDVVDRLGIGYKDLKEVNEGIIYGSISGFGQTGPYRKKPAYDVVCQAMGGFMALTGEKGGKPYKLGPSIVDASAGIHMAFALMVALHYRNLTGKGQFIDIGMMETAFSTLENFVVTKTLTGTAPTRNGNANLGSAPFNSYKTKDGYVTIAIANNKLFKTFTQVMGNEALLEREEFKENHLRKANEDELNKIVEEWTLNFTTAELVEMLDEASIPVGPILDIDDLLEDPHLKERGMLVEIDNPILGKLVYPGNPIKMSESSDLVFDPAPTLGEYNEYVLGDILGKSPEEIKELEEKNIL